MKATPFSLPSMIGPATWLGFLLALAVFLFGPTAVYAARDSSPPRSVAYRAEEVTGSDFVSRLRSELGDSGMEILLKVNRRDSRHLSRGTVLMVPKGAGTLLDHSPFPIELPETSPLPKLILVSLRIQAFAAYEYGKQIHWGPVNTGTREQPTPATLYHTNWRSPRRVSTINRNWIMYWYFNIHTSMGLALHQYAMPGYPASYGCIRLLREDAVWIYNWADSWISSGDGRTPRVFGTPVIVFGEYDYDSPPPWLSLAKEPSADRLAPAELGEVLESYLPTLKVRARERKEYFADRRAADGSTGKD